MCSPAEAAEVEEGGEATEETPKCCWRSPERKERRHSLRAVRGQDGRAGRGGLDQSRMQGSPGCFGDGDGVQQDQTEGMM